MASNTSCKTVLAATIAKPFMEEVTIGAKALNRKPKLVGILANKDPAAKMYADWTAKTSTSAGFEYELIQVSKEDVEEALVKANENKLVDGIIVYFPVFGNRQDQYLQQVISPEKDVEGLSHIYLQNLYHNIRYLDSEEKQKSLLPCTPLAIVKILEYLGVYNSILPYGNRLYGKTITIINRSEIVGRPLAALLSNDGAQVYSIDLDGIQEFTRGEGIKFRQHQVADCNETLENIVPKSDVIITGVPSVNYKFPIDLIKNGAVCINFSSEKNFDPEVKSKASLYVPSIGKVTISMLLRNLLRLIANRQYREGKEN